jgi:CheY-like chemotaxis protein
MTDQPLSGYRIVILEDDYYQASDCRHILEQAGANVVAVTSQIPDLDPLLAEGRIDVVLIDINLGHGLSFDFARTLKAQTIPFVFLTGYDAAMLPEDLATSAYLSKPADAARIVTTLAAMAGSPA